MNDSVDENQQSRRSKREDEGSPPQRSLERLKRTHSLQYGRGEKEKVETQSVRKGSKNKKIKRDKSGFKESK